MSSKIYDKKKKIIFLMTGIFMENLFKCDFILYILVLIFICQIGTEE